MAAALDKVTIVRIDGAGVDDAGTPKQYAYYHGFEPTWLSSTHVLSGTLADHPKVAGAKVGVLDGIGKGGGCNLSFVYEPTDAGVILLAKNMATFLLGSSNEDIRLDEFVSATATSFPLSSDATGTLSVGDLVWIGGEVQKVASVTSTEFTVTARTPQLGTTAGDLPYQGDGLRVFLAMPDIVGRGITITQADTTATTADDEVTIYRGIVTGVTVNAGRRPSIDVTTTSRMGAFFGDGGRKWLAPTGNTLSSTLMGFISGAQVKFSEWIAFVKTGAFGPFTSPVYLRAFTDDGRWIVFRATDPLVGDYPDDDTIDYYEPADGNNIVQVGQDGIAFAPSEVGELFDTDAYTAFAGAEWAWVVPPYTEATPDVDIMAFVGALAQGASTVPWGMTLGVGDADSDWSTIDTVMRNVLGVGVPLGRHIWPAYVGNVAFVVPYVKGDELVGDVLVQEFAEPLGFAFVPDKQGRISAIDWRDVLVPDLTIADADITSGPVSAMSRDLSTVVRQFSVSTERADGGTLRNTVISSIASAVHGSGRSIDRKVRILVNMLRESGSSPIKTRIEGLLASYERSMYRASLSVVSSVVVDVGDVAVIGTPQMPGPDGVPGSSAQRFLVTEYERQKSGEQKLTGYFMGTDVGAEWGPIAQVASYAGGIVTVDANAFTFSEDSTTDVAWFAVGDFVILLDQYGTEKVGTATEITDITGNTIEVAFATAVDGDLIALADYDETDTNNTWTWLADESAKLGAADDAAKVWT